MFKPVAMTPWVTTVQIPVASLRPFSLFSYRTATIRVMQEPTSFYAARCLPKFTAIALSLPLLCTGCIERYITITSQPDGALVYLNDDEVGRTPLTVPFTFYGTYDVRLEADGYKPLWTKQGAQAPWWDTIGVDLIAEAVPNAESHVKWHFTMELQGPVVESALVDRARQMRALVHADDAP